MAYRTLFLVILSFALLRASACMAQPALADLERKWFTSKSTNDLDSIQHFLLRSNRAGEALAWELKRPLERRHLPAAILRAWKMRQLADNTLQRDSLFSVIVSQYPKNREFYSTAARNPQWMGQPGVSADYLAAAAIVDRASSRLWLEAAQHYNNAWDAAKALIALSEWNKAAPQELDACLHYLNTFCRKDSAYFRAADSLLLENPSLCWAPSPAFRYRWSLLRNQWEHARAALGQMPQDSLFHLRALDFAGKSISAGRPDLVKALRAQIRGSPPWAVDRWHPIDAQIAQSEGNLAQAEKILRQQWSASPSAPAAVQLARFLTANKEFAAALAILTQGLDLDSDGSRALELLPLAAKACILTNNGNELEKIWRRWENLMRAQKNLRYPYQFYKGQAEATKGHVGMAMEFFSKAAETGEGQEANDAIEWTSLFSDLHADSILFLRVWQAHLLAEKNDFAKAADSLASLLGETFDNARNTLALRAAQWYVQAKATTKAADLLAKEAEQCIGCERLLIQRARLLWLTGDKSGSNNAYEDFLIRFPASLLAGEAQEALRARK